MIKLLLIALLGGSFSVNRTIIAVNGDSNTEGNAMADPDSNWVNQLSWRYPVYDFIDIGNYAVGGKTVLTMVAESDTLIDPTLTGQPICILLGGVNDFAKSPVPSVAEVLGRIKEFCEDRQAAGWYMILLTYPSNRDYIDTLNLMCVDSIAADGWADLVIRLDLDPDIGYGSDHDVWDYWEGLVHMNPGGQSIVADSVVKHINLLTGRI